MKGEARRRENGSSVTTRRGGDTEVALIRGRPLIRARASLREAFGARSALLGCFWRPKGALGAREARLGFFSFVLTSTSPTTTPLGALQSVNTQLAEKATAQYLWAKCSPLSIRGLPLIGASSETPPRVETELEMECTDKKSATPELQSFMLVSITSKEVMILGLLRSGLRREDFTAPA